MFTLVAMLLLLFNQNNKIYTFISTVNFEIVSKMFEMFENINKSNFISKYPKEKA